MYVTSRIVKSKYRVKWKHRIIDNAWRKACPIAKKVQQASASFKVKVYAWNSSYASRVPRSPLLQRTLFRSLHQTDLQPARNIRDSWLANWSSYVRNTSVELSSPGNNTDVDISMDPMQCNRFFKNFKNINIFNGDFSFLKYFFNSNFVARKNERLILISNTIIISVKVFDWVKKF